MLIGYPVAITRTGRQWNL